MKSIRYVFILLIIIIAFIGLRCDCGEDTGEENVAAYENPHDNTTGGDEEDYQSSCENAVKYLYNTCYMDWENGYAYILNNCIVGETTWKKCMSQAVESSDDCSEAVIKAEECGE